MIKILFIVSVCLLTSCLSKGKVKYDYDCYRIDTTMLLLNVGNAEEKRIVEIMDYLLSKDVGIICFNIKLDKSDSIIMHKIKKSKDRILAPYDREDSSRLRNEKFFYKNDDVVTDYSFMSNDRLNKNKPNLLLKMLKVTAPDIYEVHKNDSMRYKINYIGNKNCFFNVNESELDDVIETAWSNKIVILGYFGLKDQFLLNISDSTDIVRVPLYSKETNLSYSYMYESVVLANILSDFRNR